MLMNFKRRIALVLCIVMLLSIISLAVYKPFKVELTLFERYMCMGLLPVEANFATWLAIKEIQEELSATEEEIVSAGLTPFPSGGTRAENWNAVERKVIVFGDIAKGLIVDALERLDEQKKLTHQHFTLYEKFVLEKVEEEVEE